jgi:hypothetical protein
MNALYREGKEALLDSSIVLKTKSNRTSKYCYVCLKK